MAVLSKSGCNAGACHGNLNGKGGFKLSLRGQDPAADYESLTHESSGRRVDTLAPPESLILLKATGRISHQGGVRFRSDSVEYKTLHDWIAQGTRSLDVTEPQLTQLTVTPREQVVDHSVVSIPLSVRATYADGTTRDVTAFATYEPSHLNIQISPDGIIQRQSFGEATVIVRYLQQQIAVNVAFLPERADFVESIRRFPANNFIDELIDQKLKLLKIQPSDLTDDHVFVRRVYLDAIGVLPTADEARRFVMDDRPDKRLRLIDALLARPEFADLWALRWSDVLRNEEKVLDPKGVAVFHRWIRDSIGEGKPIDRFVRELMRAVGSSYEKPATNFWRANRDASTRGETVARLFLGIRLQCAKCHNHPFDRWTQDDYYAWSAVFARLDYEIIQNERRDKLDKNEFVGEQIIQIGDGGFVEHPRTGQLVLARMLGGDELGPGSYQDRLTPLAVWLTSPDNKMFARTMVNFIWYHLLGRGLVEPIDDLRPTNPASNEPLLQALADEFVQNDFELRHLVRIILASRVYQLSSTPNGTNRDDQSNFSHAFIARLPAEKLLDAQCQVLDQPADFSGHPFGIRAGQLPGVARVRDRKATPGNGDRFLKTFGKPERLLACECERSNETSLNQAFVLISGEEVQQRLAATDNRLDRWARSDLTAEQLIDELYWTALARSPVSAEREAALGLFTVSSDDDNLSVRRTALQDLAWALMNAKEFVFRW